MKDFVVRELEVDESVYQYLLTACKNSLPCEDAKCVAILEEMERAGHPPSIETYNIAMNACRHAGHWRRCFVVFSKMKKSGVSGEQRDRGSQGVSRGQRDRGSEGQGVRSSLYTHIRVLERGNKYKSRHEKQKGEIVDCDPSSCKCCPPPSAP